MHGLAVTALVTVGAFAGTMADNAAAFGAQLAVTPAPRRRSVSVAQFAAVTTLVALSAAVAAVLGGVSLRWVGILALAPLGLAVHAWRHRKTPPAANARRAATTFLATLSIGGDNLAIWIPLLRADGLTRGLMAAAILLAMDVALIGATRAVATHPRVAGAAPRVVEPLMPFLFVALAVLITWECGWW